MSSSEKLDKSLLMEKGMGMEVIHGGEAVLGSSIINQGRRMKKISSVVDSVSTV